VGCQLQKTGKLMSVVCCGLLVAKTGQLVYFIFHFVLSYFRVFVIRLYFLVYFMNNSDASRSSQMVTTDNKQRTTDSDIISNFLYKKATSE